MPLSPPLSLPSPPQIRSAPPRPRMRSSPPNPTMTSAPEVPVIVSLASVPTLVGGVPKQFSAVCALADDGLLVTSSPAANAAAASNLDTLGKLTFLGISRSLLVLVYSSFRAYGYLRVSA